MRFLTASELLNDLAAQEGATAFQRRLARYARPRLLVIDELGYLSYDNRHADLLYEVVSRRYLKKPILLTTNRPLGLAVDGDDLAAVDEPVDEGDDGGGRGVLPADGRLR